MQRIIFIILLTSVTLLVGFILLASQHEIQADYSEEISFEHKEDVLAGSLLLPHDSKACPVIVFVHGDGAQDRFSNEGYTVMINHFLSNGIAVFSYDKAGVGKSTGNWLHQSMNDRATEVLEAVKVLKENKRVLKDNIGLFAMSQGAWVAPKMARKEYGISYVIVLGGAVNWMQQKSFYELNQLKHLGYIPLDDSSKDMQTFIQLNKNSDSTEDLKKVDIPMFGAFGADDLRVDTKENYRVYSNIFKDKKDSKIVLFPNATHELLNAKYYNFLSSWTTLTSLRYFIEGEDAYNSEYMDSMITWIKTIE